MTENSVLDWLLDSDPAPATTRDENGAATGHSGNVARELSSRLQGHRRKAVQLLVFRANTQTWAELRSFGILLENMKGCEGAAKHISE